MSFKFHCVNCGQKLEAEEHQIGSNMNCPGCSKPLEIQKPTDQTENAPPPLDAVNWHYEFNGQPIGPVSENEIQKLIAAGKISAFTRVWTKGMPAWVNAGDSSLRVLFNSTGSHGVTAEQMKAAAMTIQKEFTKVSQDVAEKSAPFIRAHVIPKIRTPRYIVLIICSLIFLYQCGKQQTIDANIQNLTVRQSNLDSDTFWHSAGTFFGIFSGDPSTAMTQGYKLGEDLQSANALSKQKERLTEMSAEARLWSALAILVGGIAALRIAWKHWRNKSQAKRSTLSKG